MNIFCDTNVLLAAFLDGHPQHHAARPILERVKAGVDKGAVATHSLAEAYAVLTRLPGADHVPPLIAWQLIAENLLDSFSLIALTAPESRKALQNAAAKGIEGGRTYDVLLLAAAAKSGADRIYTLNVRHFHSLAEDDVRARITAPC